MSDNTKAAIYGLIDPRSGMIRYIGKANNPAKRFASHVRDSIRRNTPVYAWFRKLAGLGMQPEMLVLSECEDWQAEERRLISSARTRGYDLLNVAEGGDEPHCPRDVRVANGFKNAKDREADPVKLTIHRFMKRAGHTLKHFQSTGKAERVLQLTKALAVLKDRAKRNPELLYRQIIERGIRL